MGFSITSFCSTLSLYRYFTYIIGRDLQALVLSHMSIHDTLFSKGDPSPRRQGRLTVDLLAVQVLAGRAHVTPYRPQHSYVGRTRLLLLAPVHPGVLVFRFVLATDRHPSYRLSGQSPPGPPRSPRTLLSFLNFHST